MNHFSNRISRALAALVLITLAIFMAGHHASSRAVTLEQPTSEQSAKINAIFGWAEAQPSVARHLGSTTFTQVGQGYIFRVYPTGNYLAATNTEVYAYGPATNFTLLFAGTVNELYCSVTSCTPPVTCQAPKLWQEGVGACVAPIGVKLTDPKMPVMPAMSPPYSIPPVNGDIWRQAARDGIIQFFDTGMVLTGSRVGSEPLVGAFFRTPDTGSVCVTLVYKKNGASVYLDPYLYGKCITSPIDWVSGESDGFTTHGSVKNQCFKDRWDVGTQAFRTTQVSCQ